jgi:DnaJ-class molecular chaperone
MNLYEILEVNKNCTTDDIKQSYKRLVLKYHPDKNLSNIEEVTKKFTEIQKAYEILKDPIQRKKYDGMSEEEQMELYDTFKQYFETKIPKFNDYYKHIVNAFYDDENELKKDFNTFNFETIINKITSRLPNIMNKIDFPEKKEIDLNIHGRISAKLVDRYLDRVSRIKVVRKTKQTEYFIIPLRESSITIDGEGETNGSTHGNITVNVEIKKDINFEQLNNDLYYTKYITLYDYLYGCDINLEHIDGEQLSVKFSGTINGVSLLTIQNKGLPYLLNEEEKRGNLLIMVKPLDIDSDEIKDKIKNIYS